MRNRCLVTLALVAAFSFGPPALVADHGDKEYKHGHGNQQFDDDDHSWERRDGYEHCTYRDHHEHPPGWSDGKKTSWGTRACLRARRRSMAAGRTFTRGGLTTSTRTTKDGSSSGARSSRSTRA